jgi:hypothetical protein
MRKRISERQMREREIAVGVDRPAKPQHLSDKLVQFRVIDH